MPFAIEITLNILWIPLACLVSGLLGLIIRSVEVKKLKGKNIQLEKQCLSSDAEILSLYKEIAQIRDELKNNAVPVIPITAKESTDKSPDTSARKKLLGTSTSQKPS
jgi:hypothetical protein